MGTAIIAVGREPTSHRFGIQLPQEFWPTSLELRNAYDDAITRGLPAALVTRRWRLGRACMGCLLCNTVSLGNPLPIAFHQPYRVGRFGVLLPPIHQGCDCYESYITNLTNVTENPFR